VPYVHIPAGPVRDQGPGVRSAAVDWEAIGTGAHGEVVETDGTVALKVDGGRMARIHAQPRDTRVIAGRVRLVAWRPRSLSGTEADADLGCAQVTSQVSA
jgi:hypothetical protein